MLFLATAVSRWRRRFDRFQTTELSLKVDEETYSYNAEAFFQVNQGLLPDLVQCALANAKGEAALDLYCGVGLFTLPLARRFKKVVGVESKFCSDSFCQEKFFKAHNWLTPASSRPVSQIGFVQDPSSTSRLSLYFWIRRGLELNRQ